MIRSGRIRSEFGRARGSERALALDVGGRDSRVTTSPAGAGVGGILDRDDPLVVRDERREGTLRVVVLPEPVPPETKILSRPPPQARMKSNMSAGRGANRTRSSTVNGDRRELPGS